VIEWASPWAFALLVPVVLLALQPRLTGRNRLAVARLDPGSARWTPRSVLAWVPDVARLVGLALLVVALARPQITRRDVVQTQDGLDIMLAIDTSGSMRSTDLSTRARSMSRLEAAKGAVAEFVKARPYDRIGLVVFGEEAFTHVPLTLDHDTLIDVLDTVQLGTAGAGATSVGRAIAIATKRMKDLPAPSRIVVLLTDGRDNVMDPEPLVAAQWAADLGIRVYTIGVGQYGGFRDGIDEETLGAIARTTDARYFRATTLKGLEDVYVAIDELETSPAQVREQVDEEELYRRAAVPGAALLLLSLVLGTTWLRRGP
jgi:Ca-activated chloride channel family protein